MNRYGKLREFMKSAFKGEIDSDQERGLPQPPLEKPYAQGARVIELPKRDESLITQDVFSCIFDRKSERDYTGEAISMDELSFLLWATQGVKEVKDDNYATIRPAASAGARHPFETYLAVNNVAGLEQGIYRYLALEHKLLFLYQDNELTEKIVKATRNQEFTATAAITFIWACLPYRGEWRYADRSHKVMLIDAGHICHALYIACTALGLGNCAIGAYDQDLIDGLIEVDGKDEFTVYLSPVGKI